jgi:AcrR family transcriptional regulator
MKRLFAMPSSPCNTKVRLLDAAESLFGEHGWAGASIREITAKAGVNLAAANYHFGGKEDLLMAVLERRTSELNRLRIQSLDAVEAGAFDLRSVIEAFAAPVFDMARSERGHAFLRLMGRALADPDAPFQEHVRCGAFDEVRRRFGCALHELCPQLSQEDHVWRLTFMVGAMAFPMIHGLPMEPHAGDDTEASLAACLEQLLPFLEGGMRAPSPTQP